MANSKLQHSFYGLLIFCLLMADKVNGQSIVTVMEGVKTCQTTALRNWTPDPNDPVLKIRTRDEKGLIHAQDLERLVLKKYSQQRSNARKEIKENLFQLPIEKKSNQSSRTTLQEKNAGYVVRSGEGQNYSNINPADPSIAVGPDHVIQMINGANGSALFTVTDKSGNVLIPSSYMDQLPGTSYNGGGDCICFYDQLTDRFVMAEFGDTSRTGIQMNSLIMAVSATNDPTGSWYVYEFYTGFFPDYPKFGNWHDAWYGVTRDFTDQYQGNSIWAFEKQAMINGANIVRVQRRRLSDPDNKYNSLVAVTLGGKTPAASGTPGLFLYYNDDELTANPADRDSLSLLGFKVNFDNPGNSFISSIGKFSVEPFSSDYCTSRNCAPSAGPQGYDVVSNRIMHKPMFRNFGSYQSIVANHTIDANGNGLSGIRWYELRNSNGWYLNQQNTYAPQPILNCNATNERHRFIGAIMTNGVGQTLLAYNFSGKSENASLAFTGRSPNSPLNQMDQEEKNIKIGTGFGTDANRWGDYNDIAPDPSNDSLFWFTGMYGNTGNTWGTAIAVLKIGKGFDFDARLMGIGNPSPCVTNCQNQTNPTIRIRNNGNKSLSSLVIHSQLNKNPLPAYQWSGNLLPGNEAWVDLPFVNFSAGKNEYTVALSLPNGQADENVEGDNITINFSIEPAAQLPFLENAEGFNMPPTGWTHAGTGSSALRWQKTDKAFAQGSRSFFFDNFNNNEPGKYGEVITPQINTNGVDSLSLSFKLAAALYDNQNIDTLELRVYTDCSNESVVVYKKWGADLSTKPGFANSSFVPLLSDWRTESIDLSNFRNRNIRIGFRVINQHGQNIYIDDIQLSGILFKERDLSLTSVTAPYLLGCETTIRPSLSFLNKGKDSLKTALFHLYVNGKLAEQKKWTGIIARNGTGSIQFSSLSTKGNITQLMMTVEQVNEQSDQLKANDSISSSYQLLTPQNLPLNEGFSDPSLLNHWITVGNSETFKWEKSKTGSIDPGSLKVNNFRTVDHTDQVFTPLLTTQKADSIFLAFDVAAATPLGIPDTLTAELSWDCGNNWATIYKKWGTELASSLSLPTTAFEPMAASEWRKEKINLTAWLWGKEKFMLRFSNIGKGGNNLYLDNISIASVFLGENLKNKGYAVGPNPANDKIGIRFYPFSTGLSRIQLFDAKGRLVYSKQITKGTNLQFWEIPIAGISEGIYFLSFEVNGNPVSEKIIISHH
ncbi:MAG: hypothetical protein RJB03_194 [Bacteroidota bacterium]